MSITLCSCTDSAPLAPYGCRQEVAIPDETTQSKPTIQPVQWRRGGLKRIVGVVVAFLAVATLSVLGMSIAFRSGGARTSFDGIVLILMAIVATGPLTYLVGVVKWDGRLAQAMRIAGFAFWMLVGFTFVRVGAGPLVLILAAAAVPTLRNSDSGVAVLRESS